MLSNNKNIKLPSRFTQLLVVLSLLLLAAGFWYAGEWVKSELLVSFLMRAFSVVLALMFIWSILDWVANKTNVKWLKRLVGFLALIGKYAFYSVGAAKEICFLLLTGAFSLLFAYVVFSIPFSMFSNYIYPLESKLIIYLAVSAAVISFLEFGGCIFKLIERVSAPYIKLKPSTADLIELFRLVFTGRVLRFSVYFFFFLYLVFYSVMELSGAPHIEVRWLAYMHNIKDSVLYSFYTVLAYDAFRSHLINYEAK